jgi:hypothetical protein
VPFVPPPQKRSLPWVPLAVALGIISIALVIAALVLPGWLQLAGAPVSHFKDSTGLIEIDFPDSWHHLGLRHGGPNFPHPESKSYMKTVRGSFYFQDEGAPEVAVCFRIVSLGIAAGLGREASDEERAKAVGADYGVQVERLGGSFKLERAGTGRPGSKVLVWPISVGQHRAMRMYVDVTIDKPFYCWDDGGEFRVSIIWFSRGARINLIYVVVPKESSDTGWHEAGRMLSTVEWAAATL